MPTPGTVARSSAFVVLMTVWVTTLAGPASASAPPVPLGCTSNTVTASTTADVAIADNATTNADLFVAFNLPYLHDVDVTTELLHTRSNDLDVTLRSPAGTTTTLTTDNGGVLDDVFSNTVWDDDAGDVNAPGPVTDVTFANGVAEPAVVPEEAMSVFRGETTGTGWVLGMTDDEAAATGTLTGWKLEITGLTAVPRTTVRRVESALEVPIPDAGSATSAIVVSGLGSRLTDARAVTRLLHPDSDELDVTLTSPAGTTVTLTTDNGGTTADVFGASTWDDRLGGQGVTDMLLGAGFGGSAPEEAMGAFIGEDPNGIWTLTAADDTAGDTGSLAGWGLDLETGTCSVAPDHAVTLDAAPATVRVGEDVTVTTTVTNTTGPAAEGTGTTVALPVPAGATLRSATPSQGTCDSATFVCALGVVRAGTPVTITTVLRADAAGTLAPTASASSAPADPVSGNDAAADTVIVTEPPAPAPSPSPQPTTVTTTVAVPGATPPTVGTTDTTKPAVARLLVPGQRLRTVRSRGLKVLASVTERATLDGTLTVTAARAKALKLRSRTLGTVRRTVTAGAETTVTLKLTRAAAKALARTRSVTATLSLGATDLAGNRSARATRRVVLRR